MKKHQLANTMNRVERGVKTRQYMKDCMILRFWDAVCDTQRAPADTRIGIG